MDFKAYQERVLKTFDVYLDELATQLAKAEKVRLANAKETDPDLIRPVPDFTAKAFVAVAAQHGIALPRAAAGYVPRSDGIGRLVPNVCLKIPTGGGKTFLAAATVSRIMGKYLARNAGVVLWIVPNEAIYAQTKRQLSDRDHPYRQLLDRAAAGRVKILEKDQPLNKRDIETHLCVMLLMLQSANRTARETLRLFKDRGNVLGFFPPEGDIQGHLKLLTEIPNLDAYADQARGNLGSLVKDSLGNVLRYVRPVVVMDEGHKAYSVTAMKTVYDFNPSFVLELSATPKETANWLVDIRGKDLADEEMIKVPINVKVKSGDDWRACLRESLELLNKLQADAEALQANSARYVRPILLVQVERTGKEQREAGYIHAEDAREFLLSAGMLEREVAVKTSELNELRGPDSYDLLAPTNPVRAIITRQALQEGWDCPFAYVLCSLAASSNLSAMTQLVGRILRQPHAARTGVRSLDECYVLCHHAETKAVVDAIKSGLEADGMADIALKELKESGSGASPSNGPRAVHRRRAFAALEVFLPVVNWVDGDVIRPLEYEQDILASLPWDELEVASLAGHLPIGAGQVSESQLTRVSIGDGSNEEFFPTAPTERMPESATFDPVYLTRMLGDVVPNPWVARSLVADLVAGLRARGASESQLGTMSGYLLEEMQKHLEAQRDSLAERQFIQEVAAQRIQFRLRTDRHNWRMPFETELAFPENSPQLIRPDGMPTERSLFAPAYAAEFNSDEAEFACYLDERKALEWWHRNVAQPRNYFVQGWRRPRVYPDFIFAMTGTGGRRTLHVLETKGDQLGGNLDTEYKRKLLELVSKNSSVETTVKAGELELVSDGKLTVSCELVLMTEWKTAVLRKELGD